MEIAGFSQVKPLSDSQNARVYSAFDEGGRSVLVEPGGAFADGGAVDDDRTLAPLWRSLTTRVAHRLESASLCRTIEVRGAEWRIYPNPAHCSACLREARPTGVQQLTRFCLSLLRSLERLHEAGLILCREIEPHVVWNPQTGDAALVALDRSLPRRLGAFAGTHLAGIGCAERWRRHRASPDERIDVLFMGRLLDALLQEEPELRGRFLRLIETMTAADPEDRYQSVHSVVADVRLVLEGKEPRLRRFSYLPTYYTSGRLYGLDGAETLLRGALRSLIAEERTATELITVSGEPATGKSALCVELIYRLVDERACVLLGKSHWVHRAVPLSAFTEALRGLIRDLIRGDDRRRSAVCRHLQSISTASLLAVVSTIPELLTLLEDPPKVTARSFNPRQMSTAYAEFILALSSRLPVCLFLDDCQWADQATLELVRLLLSRRSVRLVVIMAMRGRPRRSATYLESMFEDLVTRSLSVIRISLGELPGDTIADLLRDSTGIDRERIDAIIARPERPTIPAALISKAESRQARRLVEQQPDSSGFRIDGVLEMPDGDGLLRESFQNRLDSLRAESRRVIEAASTLGPRFELSALISVTDFGAEEVAEALLDAVELRLVRPIPDSVASGGEFRFEHDIAQEVTYRAIAKGERARLHLTIAERLEGIGEDSETSLLYDIADHAHRARIYGAARAKSLSSAPPEDYCRRQIAAGEAAARAGAFNEAAEYFKRAWRAAGSDSPSHRLRCAEALISAGELDQAGELLKAVDGRPHDAYVGSHALELQARLEIRKAQERSLEERERYAGIYRELRSHLLRHGIRLPLSGSRLQLLFGLLKSAISAHRIDRMPVEAPADQYQAVIGRMLSHAAIFAYIQKAELSFGVHLAAVRYARRKGSPFLAPYSFSFLGSLLAVAMGRQREGERFGEIAARHLSEPANTDVRGRTMFHLYGAILPMLHPFRESDLPLREAYLACIEARDLTIAGVCSYTRILHRFFAGDSLGGILYELDHLTEAAASGRGTESLRMLHQAMENLLGHKEEPWLFHGPIYDERVDKGVNQPRTGPAVVSALLAAVCGRFEIAKARVRLDHVERNSISAVPTSIIHDFLSCLCGIVVDGRLAPALRRANRRLANAARHCQANFGHLYLLVRAERHRASGRFNAARDTCEQAAEWAETSGCHYAAVIAYSRLANLARARGLARVAEVYERTAGEKMEVWIGRADQSERDGEVAPAGATEPEEELSTGSPDRRSALFGNYSSRSYLGDIDIEKAANAVRRAMVDGELFKENGLRVGQLASAVDLSVHQLAELLSRHLHTSFARYINGYRVRYAAELIRTEGGVNLLDTAFRAGFSSKAAFNHAFKEETGLSPSQYRKRSDPQVTADSTGDS